MSEQEPTDPNAPTEIDPKAAFEMGAETPVPSAVANWEPPTPEELNPLFADYEIEKLLGRGGMGAVYKAVQSKLKRPVAIKLLPPEMAALDPSFAERFRREAESMAALDHPNIVHVYDFGETEAGHSYFVMEFVDGMDFHQLIHSGQLDAMGALNAVSQICDALEYAHGQGFVHRDIKPANIFINQSGVLKVGDFGLAKIAGSSQTETTVPQPALTMTGIAMGTPDYSAPEQLNGQDVDQRADIYSLGVMFYEMLTGAVPRGVFQLPSQKVQVDVRLDEVVLKAMESEPERRYPNVTEMRSDVDAVRTGASPQPVEAAHEPVSPQSGEEPKPGKTKKLAVLVLVSLAVATVAGFVFKFASLLKEPIVKPGDNVAVNPDSATKGQPFENSLGMRFVPVPITGGPTNGQRVLFSVWETRVGDYRTFVEETSHKISRPDFPQGNDHPTAKVSWEDAVAFCEWLTIRDQERGILNTNQIYRLPTDHEWSCAVGIGTEEIAEDSVSIKTERLTDVYPWGKEWPPPEGAGNYMGEETLNTPPYDGSREPIKDFDDGFERTAPVGSFGANQFGLYDLGGNLWEWCADTSLDEKDRRLMRGGSWNDESFRISASSFRRHSEKSVRALNHGFRVVIGADLEQASIAISAIIRATKEQPFENSLGMRFVPVPIIGGPSGGERVLFSIWETRVSDFQAFVKASPGLEWLETEFEQDGNHPAVRVRWPNAVAFCDWLTKEERRKGNLGPNQRYRLPTDHEWSCAVGIGSMEDADALPREKSERIPNLFNWGRAWPPPSGVGNLYGEETISDPEIVKTGPKSPIEGFRDSFTRTAPVGSFAANEFGLFDICGNASEWCQDWDSEAKEKRVVRGSSWSVVAKWLMQVSTRSAIAPNIQFESIGFRVVLETDIGVSGNNSTKDPAIATKEKPFENDLGMRFVPVPITGGPTDGERVLFSVWETRVQDFEAFVRTKTDRHWFASEFLQESNHPVVMTNWFDAVDFCEWLTLEDRKSGRLEDDEHYRLPTDHEWSCAVGIGRIEDPNTSPVEKLTGLINRFEWGSSWPPPKNSGNFAGEEMQPNPWKTFPENVEFWIPNYQDPYERTAPVGSFRANSLGIHDLIGNVYEWVLDLEDDSKERRTLRSTGWNDFSKGRLKSSYRTFNSPGVRFTSRGFRCVLAKVNPDLLQSVDAFANPAPSTNNPAAASAKNPFENSLGMRFVPVPIDGGSTDGTRILFSTWETRVQDYEAFVVAQPSRGEFWLDTEFPQQGDHPAVRVSWNDANAFCSWLTEKDRELGLLQPHERYRLPTDHEWSCAVGIGPEEDPDAPPAEKSRQIRNVYPWGKEWPPSNGTVNLFGEELDGNLPPKAESNKIIQGYRDPFDRTSPVGSFEPNPFGIHDLGGNASEWCLDLSDDFRRIVRGSAWSSNGGTVQLASNRGGLSPGLRFESTGFRVVLDSSGTDAISVVLAPTRESHDGNDYFCWRGEHVEFLLIDSDWDPERMTELVAKLDAIQKAALEITGLDLSGPESGRVVIREQPNMPASGYGPVNDQGVLQISSTAVKNYISGFSNGDGMPSKLVDQTFGLLQRKLMPIFGYPDLERAAYMNRLVTQGIIANLRLASCEAAGVVLDSLGNREALLSRSKQAMAYYEEAPDSDWLNIKGLGTIEAGSRKVSVSNLGTAVFAEIESNHGGEAFLKRFFQEEVFRLSEVNTNQEAVDNYYRAVTRAAQADLDELLITRMRIPVSASVREEAKSNP